MKKGTVRVRRAYSDLFSPKSQRCIVIEPHCGLFEKDNGQAERECVMGLLSGFDIVEVRLDPSRWPKGIPFLRRNGLQADDQGRWVLRPFNDIDFLSRAMQEVKRDGESFELHILTSNDGTVIAQINDNDEHWFLLGPSSTLNDEWLMKCKERMSDWKFKQRRGV